MYGMGVKRRKEKDIGYLTRWKCEESFRFIKQGYNLEDIRLLTYKGLRNMVALVHAVFYFLSIELGEI